MSGLFARQTVLFDPQMATLYSMDPGTREAAKSCKVAEVIVKDDTSVKQGDPLLFLDRPLPPPPPVTPPLFEQLKIKIEEELEEKSQEYQPATIVVDGTPPRLLHHNVDAAVPQRVNKFDTVVDCSDHLFSAQETQKPPIDWVNKIQKDRMSLMAHLRCPIDTVVDCSDHLFPAQETQQPPVEWVDKILEERRILKEHLPDTIFVRVYESRLDILRAAIIGQKGTPYHNCLFFFDVCFPIRYPNSPPLVRYHSGVPGISPHLNKCGDVRLFVSNELCKHERMWIPGTSNMIQLLVCIQDVILSARPLFNMTEAATSTVDLFLERKSLLFNENTLVKSLETMVYTMKNPPKNFEDLVFWHFHTRVLDILMACEGYIEGQQEVGRLIVSDSNHAPSIKFKKDVTSCITPLVEAFVSIGAKEALKYLRLTEEKSASPANVKEGISDAVHNKRKIDEDTIDPQKLMKKVFEEIAAVVDEENKVVDEGPIDSAKTKSKVPDIEIDLPHARFTIRAPIDCVISKVLVSAGTKVEKGEPLYVMGRRSAKDTLLDISSRKVEYLMIYRILLMNRRSHAGIFSMENVLVDRDQQLEDSSPMAFDEEDVLKSFENFKKFDRVSEISDHAFSKSSALNQPSEELAVRIYKDWKILEEQLPETIFVRVDESRIDLLRAVIIGPHGTPYRDGLFFFDVRFPSNYPSSVPLVHYHSGGFCINPNLDNCGEVKLSLPKTTTGSQEMMWVPGTSTLLDLLVSIQNQILTTKPVYNDFTYATMRGSVFGELVSACYNRNTNVKSLKTMVHVMKKPPKAFENFVVGHFRHRVRDVLEMCTTKAHLIMFKDDLTLCMKLLIAAFRGIGAKVPEEFLP